MRLAAFVLSGIALIACKKESSPPPAPSSSTCDEHATAFEQALSSPGAGTCATDGDCRCFPGGISPKHGCGGITDAKTGEKLASIAAESMKAGCSRGIDCAAWMCMPSCQNGKCTDAPPKNATCDARAAEIDTLLGSSSKKCQTNADCACFRGGVSKKEPCGGVTDAKTNQRVEALAKEWAAAGCKTEEVMCPAMVCESQCVKGACAPGQTIIQ